MLKNTPDTVTSTLASSYIPVLPFERDQFVADFSELGGEQAQLGKDLGEAMDQSSETWHDNAPAAIIFNQSLVLTRQAEDLIDTLHRARVVEYPDPESDVATIGSLIDVVYPGEDDPEHTLLTGAHRTPPQFNPEAGMPDELTVVTVQSPVGAALLGARPGDLVEYKVDTRRFKIGVVAVRQLRPDFLAEAQPSQAL